MMARNTKLLGLDEVQRNLSDAISNIKGNVKSGVSAGGQLIKGEAQKLTPVDEGTLRLSAFSKQTGTDDSPRATVGYTAEYAAAVHEAPMTLKGQPRADFAQTSAGEQFGGGSGKGKYWDGGENKFLEKAVLRNLTPLINLIAKIAGRNPK